MCPFPFVRLFMGKFLDFFTIVDRVLWNEREALAQPFLTC